MNKHTYRELLVFSLLFTILISIQTSCIKDEYDDPDESSIVKTGHTIPSFTVEDGKGNTFTSTQFIGKKSLLVFYHSGCKDCARELPRIEKVWEVLKEEAGYQIIAIGREEALATTETFWGEHHLTYPFFLDPDRSVYAKFATQTVPRLYAVNSKGVVTWMAIETVPETVEKLIEIIHNQE